MSGARVLSFFLEILIQLYLMPFVFLLDSGSLYLWETSQCIGSSRGSLEVLVDLLGTLHFLLAVAGVLKRSLGLCCTWLGLGPW